MIGLPHRPYQHYAIVAAATDRISEARLVFDSLNWTQNSYRMFERVGQAGDQVHICYSPTDKVKIVNNIIMYV